MGRFCEWYRAHVFMLSAQDDSSVLAKLHGVSPMLVDKVRKHFRHYDADGSGAIEYEEFAGMLMSLLAVKWRSDLSEDRLQRFWSEIDQDSSGSVDFEEFLSWYLRYFYSDQSLEEPAGPVGFFYASFNPVIQRSNTVTATLEEFLGGMH